MWQGRGGESTEAVGKQMPLRPGMRIDFSDGDLPLGSNFFASELDLK